VALTPTNTPTNPNKPEDKRKEREAAADDVLLREVDEAVRQEELADVMNKYGKPILAVVILGLAAFAGYLFWDGQREEAQEKQSETLTSALDQIEAGNLETATTTLQPIADEGSGGAKASALLLQAGIAMEAGRTEEATQIFAQIAGDGNMPQVLRDLATIREIAATFDSRDPAEIIERLSPMAVPEHAYFGSAGEMVAMAYLDQGKQQEAGTLFAEIAKNEDVPESLRSRARRLAGLYGVDAVVDVDEVLEESRAPQQGAPVQ